VRIPNAPWKFSDATVTTAGSPKYRGEDNALVLGDLLGLAAAEVDALTEAGVLQRRVPPGATP
jgi:crotonobetainyl-CoA:carnitine CoA-transferase CaiB-like acyl-CoA transferase